MRGRSRAERSLRKKVNMSGHAPSTAALAPGLPATPKHDLIFHGGKTIPDLTYTNFFLGGAARWSPSDRTNIDQALASAMRHRNLNNVLA